MPKYGNRFTGHKWNLDPRTPLSAAGGCDWPTYPAHRYLMVSDNPTGVWNFLNTDGILIENATPGVDHDVAWFSGPLNICPITYAYAFKQILGGGTAWEWTIVIKHLMCFTPVGATYGPFTGPCNVGVPLGNLECSNPYMGETGTDFQMMQVEYDQTEPPGGYP